MGDCLVANAVALPKGGRVGPGSSLSRSMGYMWAGGGRASLFGTVRGPPSGLAADPYLALPRGRLRPTSRPSILDCPVDAYALLDQESSSGEEGETRGSGSGTGSGPRGILKAIPPPAHHRKKKVQFIVGAQPLQERHHHHHSVSDSEGSGGARGSCLRRSASDVKTRREAAAFMDTMRLRRGEQRPREPPPPPPPAASARYRQPVQIRSRSSPPPQASRPRPTTICLSVPAKDPRMSPICLSTFSPTKTHPFSPSNTLPRPPGHKVSSVSLPRSVSQTGSLPRNGSSERLSWSDEAASSTGTLTPTTPSRPRDFINAISIKTSPDTRTSTLQKVSSTISLETKSPSQPPASSSTAPKMNSSIVSVVNTSVSSVFLEGREGRTSTLPRAAPVKSRTLSPGPPPVRPAREPKKSLQEAPPIPPPRQIFPLTRAQVGRLRNRPSDEFIPTRVLAVEEPVTVTVGVEQPCHRVTITVREKDEEEEPEQETEDLEADGGRTLLVVDHVSELRQVLDRCRGDSWPWPSPDSDLSGSEGCPSSGGYDPSSSASSSQYGPPAADPIYEEIEPPPLPSSPPPLPSSPPPLPSSPPPLPSSPPPLLQSTVQPRSMFEGATKYQILDYLATAKRRGLDSLDYSSSSSSDTSEDSLTPQIKKSSEVERHDSGVGSETSGGWTAPSGLLPCQDCSQPLAESHREDWWVCRKCAKRRRERSELLSELVESEERYCRDLGVLVDELRRPMAVAGLLTEEQLSGVFLNVEDLRGESKALLAALRAASSLPQEEMLAAAVGPIFLRHAPTMLQAFQQYCTRQGCAAALLSQLEKEKELLRIFLRVSQMENPLLRRMNLNSFLMVPVQRVTKYPLLLSRLHKLSPTQAPGRDEIREAHHLIALKLHHINHLTREVSPPARPWRRPCPPTPPDQTNTLRKMAVELVDWSREEVRYVCEGRLLFTSPSETHWRRRGSIKLAPVTAILLSLPKECSEAGPQGTREATLLLLREKTGRYTLVREPLYLDKCVVSQEEGEQEYFELQELPTKDAFLFKGEEASETEKWFRHLQAESQGLGAWRRRRNALANIMINGMLLRS